MAKPFVKWAGGKTRLVHELLARIPGEVRTYAEPFAGGGALFFALSESVAQGKRTLKRAILCDRNEELMATYRAVQKNVGKVIAALSKYRYDRDLYYEVRERDVRGASDVEVAARLLYLNRTCFNGLYRVNGDGKFNVPFGRYKNPRIVDAENLRAASEALAGVELVSADFATITGRLGSGDFAYFDPPYMPLTRTALFTDYTAAGFSYVDHERLANELRELRARGVLAMLSNADTPATRKLFEDFSVTRVFAPRAINSDPSKRGETSELIVTTWGQAGIMDVQLERPAGSGLLRRKPMPAPPARRGTKAVKTRPRPRATP